MTKKTINKEILFMIFLSVVCAAFLSGTRAAIGDKAELSPETISAVFDITNHKGEKNNLYSDFKNSFKLIHPGKIKFWVSNSNNTIVACEGTGSGMWDEITIVFVIDLLQKKLLGLRVTDEKETAGLGSRITEDDFLKQFTDFDLNGKVDAITGATTSSRYVEKLLRKAVSIIPTELEKTNE